MIFKPLVRAHEKSDWIGWLKIENDQVLVQLAGTLTEERAQKIFAGLDRP